MSVNGLFAQVDQFNYSSAPLKPTGSPLFGKDIVIHDLPDRDQRNIAVCSAFNGWLYAAYSYSTPNMPFIVFLRSIDNGITWNVFWDGPAGPGPIITKIDITTTGNSLSNLKVFIAELGYDPVSGTSDGEIGRYNSDWEGEELLLDESYWVKDIALASDMCFPAGNSNPNSIAILYSIHHNRDSIIFKSSTDGGITFNNYLHLAWTNRYFDKVSLSYGYSSTMNTGRYFATWEQKDNYDSIAGHIYTAHTEPDINSPFTTPVCIDSLDPSTINKVTNALIACQVNNLDNDSSNLTEVILYDRYYPSSNSYVLKGLYNMRATSSTNFKPFSITPSSGSIQQPDIIFNPFASTFMFTYFDSTSLKLPILTHNFNMTAPDSWQTFNAGYNDSSNISSPKPNIEMNWIEQDEMNSWIADGVDGNGIALFDASYSTYTPISETKQGWLSLICVYPNPCSDYTYIEFQNKRPEFISLSIFNLMGVEIVNIPRHFYGVGIQKVYINCKDLKDGCYYFSIKSPEDDLKGKIVVSKL